MTDPGTAAPDLFGTVTPVEPTADERPEPAAAETEPVQGEQFRDSQGRLWMRVGSRGWAQLDTSQEQAALFDLGSVTEALPDADIKAARDARGVSAGAYLATYEAATIKQIVTYFRGDEFRAMLERLRAVMKATGARNNTEALIKLMEHWEATRAA